jgi:hypothetical protein
MRFEWQRCRTNAATQPTRPFRLISRDARGDPLLPSRRRVRPRASSYADKSAGEPGNTAPERVNQRR